jgi:hypothetical protein
VGKKDNKREREIARESGRKITRERERKIKESEKER